MCPAERTYQGRSNDHFIRVIHQESIAPNASAKLLALV